MLRTMSGAFSLKHDYRNAGASAGKQELSTHQLNMYGCLVENETDSPVYMQLFDVASSNDVVLGTTQPDWAFEIPANSKFGISPDTIIRHFNHGLTYAVTTTRTGDALPTGDVSVSFWYWDVE